MDAVVSRKVKITDTTLRDAHQSLIATRLRTEDMLPLARDLDQCGFFSVEAWGGATFDSCIRYLNDDPWDRLRAIKGEMKHTPIQMLLRGQSRAGTIVDQARRGGYGTIVVGRKGVTRVEEFFMGRVSSKVLQLAKDMAVWVVP